MLYQLSYSRLAVRPIGGCPACVSGPQLLGGSVFLGRVPAEASLTMSPRRLQALRASVLVDACRGLQFVCGCPCRCFRSLCCAFPCFPFACAVLCFAALRPGCLPQGPVRKDVGSNPAAVTWMASTHFAAGLLILLVRLPWRGAGGLCFGGRARVQRRASPSSRGLRLRPAGRRPLPPTERPGGAALVRGRRAQVGRCVL